MCANMLRGIDTCLNMSWDKPMTRVRSVGASERREACVGGRRRTSAWSAFLCEFSTKLRRFGDEERVLSCVDAVT